MIITVSNFRGCARAELECAPVALCAGLNAAGKSSIAQAVGAALTGDALPITGMRPNASGSLVRSGAAVGSVEISGADGSATVEWPSARATSNGTPPTASVYATGLASIVSMPPKDRLRVLSEYLKAEPTRADLALALDEAGIGGDRAVNTIWTLIEQQGWDGAERLRRERGAELKGAWRQTTGANYGSRVAASWRPDLAELNEADLVTAVNNAKAERDRSLTAEAVSDAERRRLEQEAELYDARVAALERATARVEEYRLTARQTQEARAALPPASAPVSFPCPHCAGPLVFVKAGVETRVEKASETEIDNAELRRRRDAIASADGAAARAYDDLSQARRDVAGGEKAVADSREARESMDNWPRAVESGTDRTTAEAQLSRAEKRLAEWRTKAEADRLHSLVEGNEIVIGLLAGDGLRARKLARVLTVMQADLDELAEAARWQPVHVDSAGNIDYGNRPYALCSSSEQYRVRAMLAAEMARLDGSAMLIFDGADILDAPSRSGLFALIGAIDIPALVCVTLPRREQVPDLAAAGIGKSYWINGGVVEPIGEKVAA